MPLSLVDLLSGWCKQQQISEVWVAYSGGMDSHVLLHALCQVPGVAVKAIHINHHLHQDADDWARHCKDICRDLGVELAVHDIHIADQKRNIENQARVLRYAAWVQHLPAESQICLGHHQQDQAETILYRMFRGTSSSGLSGMSSTRRHESINIHRPLLDVAYDEIQNYAIFNRLSYITDPSNSDISLDRNYIRGQLLPLIHARWPHFGHQIGKLSQSLKDIDQILKETLSVTNHQVLNLYDIPLDDEARYKVVIAQWLKNHGKMVPSQTWLAVLKQQLIMASKDRQPLLHIGDFAIRRYRDNLYLCRLGSLEKPTLSNVHLVKYKGFGIDKIYLDQVDVRLRQGGERFKQSSRHYAKSLKKFFQENNVPPWIRQQVPLAFIGDTLVAIGHYAIADEFACRQYEEGFCYESDI